MTATHLELLAWLFVSWGALTMVIGASTLALGVGAVALMVGRHTGRMAAGVITAGIVTIALTALVWGGAHIATGVALRRRRAWVRTAAIGLGAVDLLVFPYGTVLGVYTLWCLLNESGRALFQESPHL
jgi:hypothetical protein